MTALETDFPAAAVSRAAEHESWRKEVHRPATHTHKWWAQRLGAVFRGILVSSVASNGADAQRLFSSAARLTDVRVFDPFAGSGTTTVEALKLGARAIARDINPVSVLVQRQAVQAWDEGLLEQAFEHLERTVKHQIDQLYMTNDGLRVLYYFWVAVARCPDCGIDCELFGSYVFAKHAYPRRHRAAHATCAVCHDVVPVDALDSAPFTCSQGHESNREGPVSGQFMTCPNGHRSKVVDSLAGEAPSHRMYAKLVLDAYGKRRYLPIDKFDRDLYEQAQDLLRQHEHELVLPTGSLADGYNTRQALRWGYGDWRQFFNSRQLYSLGLLGAAIRDLRVDPAVREALAALFSGCLEFNNMFCSYKGEGTGAVRHMFSHHILKPERTPLEAYPWGTPQSSGSFSTLFRSRLGRALAYKQHPHDTIMNGSDEAVRAFGLSQSLNRPVVDSWRAFETTPGSVYIAAGDSAATDLPDASIDLIITDPPFMDNVHYSELADFFHAWLKHLHPFASYDESLASTRLEGEVQSTSPADFEQAIQAVWIEAARVLKKDGLLAFTFHQAKPSGWVAVMHALAKAGLVVTAVQPVKAEMSVSVTKAGAAAPSNLDSIVVCRTKASVSDNVATAEELASSAERRLTDLRVAGVRVGLVDIQSVVRGSVMALLTRESSVSEGELLRVAELQAARVARNLGADDSAKALSHSA